MPPTSAPATGATHAAKQTRSYARRPVYQVSFQRTREPRRNKRQFSELSKKLRIAVMLFISGCLGWAVIVGTAFLIFIVLFAKAASTILPLVLARFP
jgi:hypothetical protein